MIKNLIRQRGLVRSGGPALLTGTGMAFPRKLFEKLPLATGNIVEDLALTVRLAGQRIRPRLEPNARVWSAPAAAEDTLIQRERWEHGFLETALRFGLPSILSGLRNRNWVEARLGLHLLVPPLVLLFLVTGVVLLAGLAGIAAGMAPAFAVAVGISLTLSIIALAAAWWTEGRRFLAFRTLLRIPGYMLWKIPVYLKFVRARQTEWIRTERTPD
jgi:cellulose synthase/poly-beta-1,6-N-acetylglucosamine synthase-like glycosyltransferase